MDNLLSTVICTHNRANLLPGLIRSIAKQNSILGSYEFIFIDNNSTDNTKAIISNFSKDMPNVKYIFEKKVGLSNARNRGWKEANGTYVGYLDDDAIIPPEWLQVAYDVATRISPVAFGGPFFAFYNSPKPKWFKDEYASYTLGKEPLFLEKTKFLIGGNMFIRRDYLERLGGFDARFGMEGNKLAYGEESKFFVDLRHQYPEAMIYYEPKLYINHLVRPEKMTLHDIPHRWMTNGIYSFRVLKDLKIINEYDKVSSSSSLKLLSIDCFILFRLILWFFYTFSLGLIIRDRSRFPFINNFLYEKLRYFFMEFGRRIESIRQIIALIYKR